MLELKIGRHVYQITDKDRFMDNGKSVQLLTQSKEKSDWGRQPNPILSKIAIKEIDKYERNQHKNKYIGNVQLFNLAGV